MARTNLSKALARLALTRLRGEISSVRAGRLTRALILEEREDADAHLSHLPHLRHDPDDAGRPPIHPSGDEANHD